MRTETEMNDGSKSACLHLLNRLVGQLPEPSATGFYWWRLNADEQWRMVHVVNFGLGIVMTYDVEYQDWGGRSLKAWKDGKIDYGEWAGPIPLPNYKET